MKVWTDLVSNVTYNDLEAVVGPDDCSGMKDTGVSIILKSPNEMTGDLRVSMTRKEAKVLVKELMRYTGKVSAPKDDTKGIGAPDTGYEGVRKDVDMLIRRMDTTQVIADTCYNELMGMKKKLRSIGETL